MNFRHSRYLLGAISIALSSGLVACGSDPYAHCSSKTAIASFTLQFGNGLDNFSEDQYSNLRSSTSDAIQIAKAAESSTNREISSAASDVHDVLLKFQNRMNQFSWDVSTAVLDSSTNEVASQLATTEILRKANLVESFVIETCGMPTTVDIAQQNGDTLPMPYIAGPTATDPPTNTINENSEDVAIGTTVANLFKLTLIEAQVKCLGNALRGVYDQTTAYSNANEYQAQFQSAFDLCEIDFQVPTES